MQGLCNVPLTEGWVIALLYVFGIGLVLPLVAIPPYVQSGLNKVWRLYPPAEGSEVELTEAPAPPQDEQATPEAPAAETSPAPSPPPSSRPPDPGDRLD
jgi:hypothetical protein